ncbi:hypothetical protein GN156_10335 [bacterium LRH843]|nr:hypothetical protein [bacterium LRH843]
MNIVKRLKTLNLSPLPKRPYSSKITYLPALFLGSLIGTYLDLYFVGKNIYTFPVRPYPHIFSINILFTLIGLPILLLLFLQLIKKMDTWLGVTVCFLFSLIMAIGENLSEQWFFFQHIDAWKHSYSVIGYFLFFIFIWTVFKWTNQRF